MNKPQIKVKELPVGYFVTDTYYPSGNVEFVSIEYKCQCGTDNINKVGIGTDKTSGLQVCCWCGKSGFSPKETFGTKHIQLIAPNTKFWESKQLNEPAFIDLTGNIVEIDRNNMDKLVKIKNQGKDFFIYKVTEVKDVI